jgi:hypothetical protein
MTAPRMTAAPSRHPIIPRELLTRALLPSTMHLEGGAATVFSAPSPLFTPLLTLTPLARPGMLGVHRSLRRGAMAGARARPPVHAASS